MKHTAVDFAAKTLHTNTGIKAQTLIDLKVKLLLINKDKKKCILIIMISVIKIIN